MERADVYPTNVVKHFKYVPAERGKRRLHEAPSHGEILTLPESLRREGISETVRIMATTHPSAVLRAPDRHSAYADLRADFEVARGR